ncbi:unnamed protein product, partial [Nesidiocoris tenuis]
MFKIICGVSMVNSRMVKCPCFRSINISYLVPLRTFKASHSCFWAAKEGTTS